MRAWGGLVSVAAVLACGPATTSPGNESSESGGTVCVPGTVDVCPCLGGVLGVQSCNAEGAGYDACQCPMEPTSDTGTGGGDTTSTTSPVGESGSTVTDSADSGSTTGDPGGDSSSSSGSESSGTTGASSCPDGEAGCPMVDLLFVVDNSGSLAEEQAALRQAVPHLVDALINFDDFGGNALQPDVQVMVTTSDFGNPLCTPFEPTGYDPAQGAPTTTVCTSRLADFTGLGSNPSVVSEVCTDGCVNDAEPSDDFVAFWGPTASENNVPDVAGFDVDGDGVVDGDVAQALACLLPQGINGCGYESQLENMLQALNPSAAWNSGATPFLRDDAMLAIAILTDEADCSVKDYSIMTDESFQEINPDNGTAQSSSAICWNAGVTCTGPDMSGEYSDCESQTEEHLQPVTRYTDYLIEDLRETQGKEIVMLGIVGVPEVTAYSATAPFQPTAGGIADLVYRDWQDGEYPAGDILPAEFANGVDASDKEFQFGIGPGCTGTDGTGGFMGQAIPPVRIREVCEALDITAMGDDGIRCCLDSVCDNDYSGATACLVNLIKNAI